MLLKALDTDLEWVRAHTRLLTRAVEWDSKKRNDAFVLRGADLRAAEEWLVQAATGKEPKPPPLQSEYILASRKAATRQQRVVLTGVSVALIVAIVLAVLAVYQADVATNAKTTAVAEANARATEVDVRTTAEANAVSAGNARATEASVRATAEAKAIEERNLATSRELAGSAVAQLAVDPELSVLLATKAIDTSYTVQAEDALRQSLAESRLRFVLRGHLGQVDTVQFSPNGKLALSASSNVNDGVRIWDVATGEQLALLENTYHGNFSPDSKQVVTTRSRASAQIWDVDTGKELAVFLGHTDGVWCAQFSPDGKRIVTGSIDRTARVWDINTQKEIVIFRGHSGAITDVQFSPDGTKVISSSYDNTARVWDVNTGKELLTLSGHSTAVTSAQFSPDGKLIVTVGRTARVWDAVTGEERTVLYGHIGAVLSASFSSDGKYIVTTGEDRTARVHFARLEDVLALARTRVPPTLRQFTCEERQRFLHEQIACPTPTPLPTATPSK